MTFDRLTNDEPHQVAIAGPTDASRSRSPLRPAGEEKASPGQFNCSLCGSSSPLNETHKCKFTSKRAQRRVEEGLKRQREQLEQLRSAERPVCDDCGEVKAIAGHYCAPKPKGGADEQAEAFRAAGFRAALRRAGFKAES